MPYKQAGDQKHIDSIHQNIHPNKYAHSIIGDAIFNYLNK